MIPRIIHHVWTSGDAFHPKFHAWRQSWARHHPDWTLMFWRLCDPVSGQPPNDPRLAALLAESSLHYVLKSDLVRLYALDVYGGLYVDTDFECFRPFDDLLDDPRGFFAGEQHRAEDEPDRSEPIAPGLMGAEPGHAFVRDYLAAAIDACSDGYAINPVPGRPDSTRIGPKMMTRLAQGRSDITLHPPEWFYTGSIYAHHWSTGAAPGGWKGIQPVQPIQPDAAVAPPVVVVPPPAPPPASARPIHPPLPRIPVQTTRRGYRR